jgi:hypothetical protein
MTMTEQLRIEGPPESLELLRRELLDEEHMGINVQPISQAVPGELREPILTGLVLTVSSRAAIKAAAAVIQRRMQHLERMEELKIFRENSDREIAIVELLAERLDS